MATHSNVLAWRIPGMAEPGGLPSMGSHRVGHYWSDLAAAAAYPHLNEEQFIGSKYSPQDKSKVSYQTEMDDEGIKPIAIYK